MILEDLDAFLEDHGKPCVVGACEFLGILDAPGEVITVGGGDLVATDPTLTVKSSVIRECGIKMGTALTHDGVPYKARQPRQIDDGVFTVIPLAKG